MTTPEAKPTRVVRCPKCRKSTRYDPANPFRPFCSALCKNEDIIAWAEGSYGIPVQHSGDEEESAPMATPPPEDE